MGKIHLLPPVIANQIAAGEVVERPASVIKELLENSIDAGSTEIHIEILNGGLTYIKLSDNGKGVSQEDLPLSLQRHATSKIYTSDDLVAIKSLGFRGEALASIASVSKLSITSKTQGNHEAFQCRVSGDELKPELLPAAHPEGTTVEVRDLFYNIPVRRKFLKSAKTEFARIDEIVKRIALSHYQIGFKLSHNHKLLRDYPKATTEAQQKKRVEKICGKSFVDNAYLLHFANTSDYALTGYLGTPNAAKRQADCQYFFVNGRMVRDRVILHAIKSVYLQKGVTFEGLYPAYILYLNLPANRVDVNVHPTKHEVRFLEASFVHDFITKCLTDILNRECVESVCVETGEILSMSPQLVMLPPELTATKNIQAAPLGFGSKVIKKLNQSSVGHYSDNQSIPKSIQATDLFYAKSNEENLQSLLDQPGISNLKFSETVKKTLNTNTAESQIEYDQHFIFKRFYFLPRDEKLWVIDLVAAKKALLIHYFSLDITGCNLLGPVQLSLNKLQATRLATIQTDLALLGFEVVDNLVKDKLVTKVPALFLLKDINILFQQLLNKEYKQSDIQQELMSVLVNDLEIQDFIKLPPSKLQNIVSSFVEQFSEHQAICCLEEKHFSQLFQQCLLTS